MWNNIMYLLFINSIERSVYILIYSIHRYASITAFCIHLNTLNAIHRYASITNSILNIIAHASTYNLNQTNNLL